MTSLPALLFQSAEGNEQQTEYRLLLVSYHFPPDSAVGARRWEKLAHYAAARGWGIDVITCRDPRVPLTPAHMARLHALPAGIRVYGVSLDTLWLQRFEHHVWRLWRTIRRSISSAPSSETSSTTASSGAGSPASEVIPSVTPASIAREDVRWHLHHPRGWLRAYWAWLEYAQIDVWNRQVAQLARPIVRLGVHRAVITSGPPHMTHDAGRRIAEVTGLPFVMDMRDPWGHVERVSESTASPVSLWLAARYERRAVASASLIVANTELSRRNLQAMYPTRANDIMTVMNGADDDLLPPSRRGGRFVIAHAGTLYLDRDPRALFQAAARVIRELGLTPEQFGLAFIGDLEAVGGFPIQQVAEQEGIAPYVSVGPLRPYAEAMQFMAEATMLVTMSGSNAAAIPAKTFECVRFDAWLLALSAPGSATALLLQGTEADVVAPHDADGIAAAIRRRYLQHAQGVTPVRIGQDDRFSRSGQAKILLDALEARVQ